jgi:hypothetical protein
MTPSVARIGRTRDDVSMGCLRVERFSDPTYLAHVVEGTLVPAQGWAIRDDGDVFFDGVKVGHSGKYMLSRDRATPYAEISYEELDA